MRPRTVVPFLAGAVAAVLIQTAPASAQKEEHFSWHGRVAAGQTVEIRGINGYIHATAGTGDVEVTAVKRGRRSNPADVKIEVVPSSSGVTICAVYPAPSGHAANECRPGGGRGENRDNDVEVNFDLKVPAGVRLDAHNVNGDIQATNLGADVDASTVNGGIRATALGLVRAKTVNGGIDVTMGRADWNGSLDFATVNGGITVTLPANVSADVEAQTVNGGLSTDFPLTVQGRFLRNRIHGTIGQGGRQLRLQTVNGGIEIRKR